VAEVLVEYAKLLRLTQRPQEADRLDARVRAIPAPSK